MEIKKCFLTKNDCFKAAVRLKPVGIMVHSTGANNPNITRYTTAWDKPGVTKCVHGFIGYQPTGEVGFYQTLPFDYQAWHCGKSGNQTHLSFEICEDSLLYAPYFTQAMRMAQELCAYLMKEMLHTDNPEVIVSHHEGYLKGIASNHADIDHWLKIYGKNMDWFRACVAKIIKYGGNDPLDYEDFKKYMDRYLAELYAKPASNWAKVAGVTDWAVENSISDGSGPQGLATREQVLLMIKNALAK